MLASFSKAYHRFLARWTDGVVRRAWPVVVGAVLASLVSAVYLGANLRISTDTSGMLSPDLPFQRLDRELDQAFPQFSDTLLIVIDAETPDLADDAARQMTARLVERPRMFADVFDPTGSDFFRRNGFLYLDLAELQDLSDRLAEAQPFLGSLWRDPNVVGLFGMIGKATDNLVAEPEKRPLEIAKVLNAIADVVEAQAEGRFRHLSWQALMSGNPATGADARRVIVVRPNLNFGSLSPAAEGISSVRAIARELRLTPDTGVSVRLTGSAALEHEELRSVEQGMGLAGLLSLTLVVGLLMAALRSGWLVVATVATLVMGLVWTAAFAIAALGALNLISVAFAVLFIGLSVDFGIHYGLRYKEGTDRGMDHAPALRDAAIGVGGALTLCAVSAAIAFYSFLPTDYLGLAELGLIAGTGMFIAFFANMTVLPALLTVMPERRRQKAADASAGVGLGPSLAWTRRNGRAVCWAALGVGLVAAVTLPKAAFDFDPLNLKDPATESVSAMFDLMDDSRTSPYRVTILAESLDAAAATGARLEALPEVDSTATLLDFVPADQAEKLDIIASMGLFLMPSFASAGSGAPPTPAERAGAFDGLRQDLRRLADHGGGSSPEATAAVRLLGALARLSGDDAPAGGVLVELENRLLTALSGRVSALLDALSAEPVTLQTLPASLARRFVATDGRARLTVHPTENLHDRDALARFVGAVRNVTPNATGSSVVILEAGTAVLAAFWTAGLISVALITVLLVIVLGRLRDAAMVFAPLILASLLTVAATVVLQLPFNFANVIVLPLLFGLGVASGIHIVTREREEESVDAVFTTSTPRAVAFSALTTIGSFGSIAISSHPGTASMGILLTIAIVLTLVCTMVVLPALMSVDRTQSAARRARRGG